MISDKYYKKIIKIINETHENSDYGIENDVKEKEFIKTVSLLNPQSYGFRIERWIQKNLGAYCGKVSSKLNRGDLKLYERFIEVKSSIITDRNNSLNLVQIRLYQNLDYYICCAFDLRDIDKYKSYFFLLSHDEMEIEMARVSSSNAHGTKESLVNNKNVELRYSLNINNKDKVFKRWKKNYRYNKFSDIISKIEGE